MYASKILQYFLIFRVIKSWSLIWLSKYYNVIAKQLILCRYQKVRSVSSKIEGQIPSYQKKYRGSDLECRNRAKRFGQGNHKKYRWILGWWGKNASILNRNKKDMTNENRKLLYYLCIIRNKTFYTWEK
jgi:hypothetical protein